MSIIDKATWRTCTDKKYCDYKWIINDYTFFAAKNDGTIHSPVFEVSSDEKNKFELHIWKGQVVHDKKWKESVRLDLHCIAKVAALPCQYKISMIKDDRIIETFTDDAYSTSQTSKEIFNIFSEQFKRFISPAGTVIIRCELTLAIGARKDFLSDESIDTYAVSVPKYHFDGIYLDKNLSDVKLKSSCGKEIPAHRIVLAAASPVFKAMFNHDMLENKTQSVDMNDISYDTAVEVLRYIYTGAVKDRKIPFIIDLSAAADKYQLDGLKNKCEQILGSKLSAENAIDILKAADKYSMKSLKQKAVDFVKSNIIDSANPDKAGTMILSMAEFLSK